MSATSLGSEGGFSGTPCCSPRGGLKGALDSQKGGRRGKGHATAAARELVALAHAAGCRLVIAHTLPVENPSTAVLERGGFTRTAEIDDPDEGRIWRWELPLAV